jgi:hypothetical protein
MLCSGWLGGRDGRDNRGWIVSSTEMTVRLLDWLPSEGSDAFETVACVGRLGFSLVGQCVLEHSQPQ